MAGRYPRRSSGKPEQGGHNGSSANSSTGLDATRNTRQSSRTSRGQTTSTPQLPNDQPNPQTTLQVQLRARNITSDTDDIMDLASDDQGGSAPAPASLPRPRRGAIRQRDLRRSNYSLNPTQRENENDSGDDNSDCTPDFLVASRLQREEYTKADAYQHGKLRSSGGGPRRSLRSVSGSVPTPLPLLPSRRGRDDNSVAVSGPAGKRQKLEGGLNSGTSTPGDHNSAPIPRRSARVNGSSSRLTKSFITASDLLQAGSSASTSSDTPDVSTSNETPDISTPNGVIHALAVNGMANGATSTSTPNDTTPSTDAEMNQAFSEAIAQALEGAAGTSTRVNTRSRRAPVNFISASQLFSYGNNATVPGQNGDPPGDNAMSIAPPEQDENASIVTADGVVELELRPEMETSNSSAFGDLPPVDHASELELRLEMAASDRRAYRNRQTLKATTTAHNSLVKHHPVLDKLWKNLKKEPVVKTGQAPQPARIHRQLKPFQLEGLAWMQRMEAGKYKGGILGDEMGLGKTIQAVSLIMSDFPARKPSLVLVPPVALMQWVAEIDSYTDNTLKTFVFHGTNSQAKSMKLEKLKKFDVIIMSYNSLESMYRRETKGHKKKKNSDDDSFEIHTKASLIHKINFHRIILDEAHEIKTRNTSTARACFALKGEYRWCLTGTPLQNVIGEFFSLVQFLNIRPFCLYVCKSCSCEQSSWNFGDDMSCGSCTHTSLQHVSVFNHELLGPIQRYGREGLGGVAFNNLLLLTDHIMLRRLKKDHTNAMQLPVKELEVSRQFFTEAENETVREVTSRARESFEAYVMDGTVLNNYASIFSLIMSLRQTADHPDLLSKRKGQGNTNIFECCICESPAEDAIISKCRHHFCRACARSYLDNVDQPECPRCHVPLSVDLTQPEVEQDQMCMKKSSIINRIKRENWKSSTKIEMLVHELYQLRSDSATHKSIIFSQFTSMLQLIEWRLRHAGFTTVMLDGTMTPAQRSASINHFMQNVDVECFLVSLKAGGVALNLTEASRVFIIEPWWNPAVEWQSADRCHRIGQTRPCIIKNLVIEDSVESRMVLLQEKKTAMIHSTIDRDSKAAQSLTPRDMQFLFRG